MGHRCSREEHSTLKQIPPRVEPASQKREVKTAHHVGRVMKPMKEAGAVPGSRLLRQADRGRREPGRAGAADVAGGRSPGSVSREPGAEAECWGAGPVRREQDGEAVEAAVRALECAGM